MVTCIYKHILRTYTYFSIYISIIYNNFHFSKSFFYKDVILDFFKTFLKTLFTFFRFFLYFYENFSFEPKGKYVIKVCDGTACHVRKSTSILERLYKELGVTKENPTTPDMLFTLETVSCLGACGLAPVLTVNDKVYPAMTPDAASELIKELRGA